MGVLQDHQKRIGQLRDGLNRLLQLYDRLYQLHNESMALAKARTPGYEAQVQALREEAEGMQDEISMLREYLGEKRPGSP